VHRLPAALIPEDHNGPSGHTGMHSRVGGARQAEKSAANGARPWPSVETPTVRTDRPHGPAPVRYASVDTATCRAMALRDDTGRYNRETAHVAENSQLVGRFRWWWQVLGSNQRRLSRRFYRPLATSGHLKRTNQETPHL